MQKGTCPLYTFYGPDLYSIQAFLPRIWLGPRDNHVIPILQIEKLRLGDIERITLFEQGHNQWSGHKAPTCHPLVHYVLFFSRLGKGAGQGSRLHATAQGKGVNGGGLQLSPATSGVQFTLLHTITNL